MIAALLLTAAAPALLAAQPRPALGEAAVRALTRQAESAANGDRDAVVLGLDERVRERCGDFESFPVSLVRREDLSVVLTTPFMSYRRAVAEHLRMREPLGRVPWVNDVVITVSVERIGAPDIVSIQVTRDGQPIAPLRNRLRPMTFTNGNGEAAVLHAGEIHYPLAAFAPGATVSITVIPKSGEPFVRTLGSEELSVLK